ncbi:MAG: hypothetical protein H6731_00885 [Myxococcales bacterium]|nr:MAG: hypothetical protein H6731_00885 [Myxococcales bacterium]
MADAVVNMMADEMMLKDQDSIDLAKDLVTQMALDPMMMEDIKNGDLVLDEATMSDLFLKDTVKSAFGTVTNFVSSTFKTMKDVAKGALGLANKALTTITNSDELMFLIKTGVSIANVLIPIGATALGGALVASGVGLSLIPVIAAVTPVLMAVVTPGNVETALNVAQATASLADGYINPPTNASQAPSSLTMLSLEKKAKKLSAQEAGEGLVMLLKANKALGEFVQSKKWNKVAKQQQKRILAALDKSNKVIAKIDTGKL